MMKVNDKLFKILEDDFKNTRPYFYFKMYNKYVYTHICYNGNFLFKRWRKLLVINIKVTKDFIWSSNLDWVKVVLVHTGYLWYLRPPISMMYPPGIECQFWSCTLLELNVRFEDVPSRNWKPADIEKLT